MKSKIIQELLDSITPEERERFAQQTEEHIKFQDELTEKGHIWNTPTSYSIAQLIERGFNPIGITTMLCEETFIFETEDEMKQAHQQCQVEEGVVDGWWYSRTEFYKARKEYVEKFYNGKESDAPHVFWF